RLLKDIADAAPVRRQRDPARRIEQHRAIDRDAPALRPREAGDDVDDRGLAGARAAEERRHPGACREAQVEREGAEATRDLDLEDEARESRRPMRRARSSAKSSAAIESTTEMTVRRNAPASPPGTCVRL